MTSHTLRYSASEIVTALLLVGMFFLGYSARIVWERNQPPAARLVVLDPDGAEYYCQ